MDALDCARERVRAVLETIDSVLEMDFPYEDPRTAIRCTRALLQEHQDYLDETYGLDGLRMLNGSISLDTEMCLDAIGFMVRACNIRGALELQGPFLRLTHRALGDDAKQVISSEWELSPFTVFYAWAPVENYVLVGLPVTEAGNPLIAPSAGHELGHNVWRKRSDFTSPIDEALKANISEAIKGPLWDDFARAFLLTDKQQVEQPGPMASRLRTAKAWGLLQCEEMFCDFFGVCIFGQGYLNAFQYLVSPGGGRRSPRYPSMRDRISALVKASKMLNVSIPDGFELAFDACDAKDLEPTQRLFLAAVDIACKKLVPTLVKDAQGFCVARGLMSGTKEERKSDKAEVQRIFDSFVNGLPATGARSLANIVNAAWRIARDKTNHWAVDYPITEKKPEKRLEFLRELTLKSFEVFEIERLQQEKDNQGKENAALNK